MPAARARSASRARRPATAVVLPVPGPPVSIVVQRRAASRRQPAARRTPPRGRPAHAGLEDRRVDLGGLAVEAIDDVAADLHLLAPVAVEVEQRVSSRRTSSRTSGLAATTAIQAQVRPGKVLRLGLVLDGQVGDGGEVEAGGALAYGADRQSGGEQHRSSVSPGHRAEPGRRRGRPPR